MDDSWRFQPIQSTICPVCSTSHFPFCPPPSSLINQPPYPHPHHHPPPLHYPPSVNHRTVHPLPPPPPSQLPPPHYTNRFVVGDEFPDRDMLRKRMRVEDPNPSSFSWDDERRLSLIREHGRQDPAQIVDRSFNPTPSHQNFDNYRNFQERRDFYGGEYDSMRSSWQRPENERNLRNFSHDRLFYRNESSSHNLLKQAQYSQPGSYETMPRIPNSEQENPFPPPYPKVGTPFEHRPPFFDEIRKPFEPHVNHMPYESNEYRMDSAMMGRVHSSQMYPPLPPQPPLPPPPEPSPPPSQQVTMMMSVPPHTPSPAPTKVARPMFPTTPMSQRPLDHRSLAESSYYNEMHIRNQAGFASEGLSSIHQTHLKEYTEGREQKFSLRNSVKDKPTVIDACHLFRQPHRASRPDHIVIILRGLPGSGKSYLAKALRDLEVETGGNAPRIHAMDDYFMIEVEKVEDNEGSKSSGSSRGRKQITKKVIEYCYEPEMEKAYRSSMLKAFKKTLDEGNFTFIIVDDRNLRVADFAQFWAIAKRSGYEVYLLEAMYKDPMGCAARNVHGFTIEDIQKMADQWEEAPSLYLQLDIQSLFRGDNLNEQSIQEVDMDTDDTAYDVEETNKLLQREDSRIGEPKSLEHTLESGSVKIGERWNSDDEEDEVKGVELGDSKWSKDLDHDTGNSDGARGNLSALSGLIQAYGKKGKSVHWGDQVGKRGFSIGALKKQNNSSLIIGPGSGYNLSSNPLQEDDALTATDKSNINELKRKFTEQLRAERESFKAVFDRRRQRIGVWDGDED